VLCCVVLCCVVFEHPEPTASRSIVRHISIIPRVVIALPTFEFSCEPWKDGEGIQP